MGFLQILSILVPFKLLCRIVSFTAPKEGSFGQKITSDFLLKFHLLPGDANHYLSSCTCKLFHLIPFIYRTIASLGHKSHF